MKILLMEFLGTFFFIFTVAMTAHPIAIACMLMAWVYIGANVSGAHYNPVITFAAARSGAIHWNVAPLYMGTQVAGGIAAYALTHYFIGEIAIPHPGAVTLLQAGIMEILLSFVFAFVVLIVATGRDVANRHIAGFAIGFTVPVLALLGGPISGGLFNPAIALGANIIGIIHGFAIYWTDIIMYVLGGLIGGGFAAHAYEFFEKK